MNHTAAAVLPPEPEVVIDDGDLSVEEMLKFTLLPVALMGVGFALALVLRSGWIIAVAFGIKVAIGLTMLVHSYLQSRQFKARAVPGTAEVLEVEPTRMRINKVRVQCLRMRVKAPNLRPYQVLHRLPIPKPKLPLVEPGAELSVRVDPLRLGQLQIQWS